MRIAWRLNNFWITKFHALVLNKTRSFLIHYSKKTKQSFPQDIFRVKLTTAV